MSPLVIEIADAVNTRLAGASVADVFDPKSFTPERTYDLDFDLEALETLTVVVAAAEQAAERQSRSGFEEEYIINVGVMQRAKPSDKALIDSLLQLVQEIMEHMRSGSSSVLSLANDITAHCTGTANVPIYDPQLLKQKHTFQSVIGLTYTVSR